MADPLDIFGSDPLDIFGTSMTMEERMRRNRERLGPGALQTYFPGQEDEDEEEEEEGFLSRLKGFAERNLGANKAGYTQLADLATSVHPLPGSPAPEYRPFREAAERLEKERKEEQDKYTESSIKKGLSPVETAALDTVAEVLDPLDLAFGAIGTVRRAGKIFSRAGKAGRGAREVVKEAPKPPFKSKIVQEVEEKAGKPFSEMTEDEFVAAAPNAARGYPEPSVDNLAWRLKQEAAGMSDGPVPREILEPAKGEPGINVESQFYRGQETDHKAIVFRDPEGKPAGILTISFHEGAPDTLQLAVKPEHRGQGIATLMFDRARKEFGFEAIENARGTGGFTDAGARFAYKDLRRLARDDEPLSSSDLPISRKEGALRSPETPFQYNAATLDMPEGQLDTVKEVMESADVAAQRRAGIQIDYNDTTRLQEELGLTEADFLQTEPGTVYNREQGVLLDAYIGKYGRVVEALRPKVVSGVATPAEELAFNQARARQVDLLGVSMGNRSEIARAMESYKHLRTALGSTEDLRSYLTTKFLKLKEAGKVTDADLDLLAKADLDNPEELSDLILKINKSKWWEQLTEVFKSFILSGLGTNGRNAVGNSLMTAVAVPVKIGQAIIESPKALVGAKREAYFSEIMPMVYGGIEGVSDGWKRAVVSWQRGATEGSKFDIAHGGALRRSGSKIVREKVAPAVEIPFRILTFTDEFFKGMNGEMFARSEAVKRGINEGLSGDELTDFVSKFLKDPPEDFIKAKVKYEKFQTFQSELGHSAKRWQKAIQSTPGVEGIIPFFRTPVNLFKRGLEFTPINTPRGLLKMLKGDPDAADQLSRSALGSAMMAFTWSKAQKGEITGPVPKDQEKAAQFWAEGKKPFSIRVGDRWYPVGQIEPLAMPFAMMASYTEGVKNEEVAEASNWNKLSIGMGYMLSNQLDRSYLSGLSELMRMTTQGEGTTVERLSYTGAQQLSAATVPFSGLMEDVAQLADEGHPLRRKDKLSHHWMAKIPGLRDNIPLRQEARFGGPITRTKWEVLGPTGTPVVPSRVTDDEITLRLRDLGITVGLPTKSVEGVRLSDEEYEDWLAYVGPKTKNMVGQMIFDDGFAQLPEHVRQESLDRFITNAVTNPAKVEAMMGLVPEIPPLVLRKQLKGAVDQFKSSRSVISARYNDTHRRPGSTSVSELFETAQEAEEDWKQSYAFIVEQARLVRAEGMERDKVIEFLRKQGVSNRVARAVAYGKDMSYEQYRKRAGGF